MREIFFNIHHYLGMATLVFILLLTVVTFIYYIQKRTISGQVRKISLIALIFTHLQAIIGIALLIVSFVYNPFLRNMKDLMGIGLLRQRYIEHPTSMIIAAVLITIAHTKIKKSNTVSFAVSLMTAISLALVIGMIPRTFWAGLF